MLAHTVPIPRPGGRPRRAPDDTPLAPVAAAAAAAAAAAGGCRSRSRRRAQRLLPAAARPSPGANAAKNPETMLVS